MGPWVRPFAWGERGPSAMERVDMTWRGSSRTMVVACLWSVTTLGCETEDDEAEALSVA